MQILYIYKSPPDEVTSVLATAMREMGEVKEFHLYRPEADYEALVDLIFQSEKVFCWF